MSLSWLPGSFAAQLDTGLGLGKYLVTLTASDGMATYQRQLQISVANTNQAPVVLPMPMQLVYEGQTLGFTVLAQDADNDALRYSLVYDDNTPKNAYFDATTGYFEWTPEVSTVNNATDKDKTFNFTFAATDGQARVLRTVQVRVLDVNRTPTISASNHAVAVGNSIRLPIVRGNSPTTTGSFQSGIYIQDADGSAQTQALTVSFKNLPEGAVYDATSGKLTWIPGPGQIGDYQVTATVSDGRSEAFQVFTLRVVADKTSIQPDILVNLTPQTPILPGQLATATIRAQSYSSIAKVEVQARGAGIASSEWQTVQLDNAGRLRLTPTNPGLVEIQVTATDIDGFSHTTTQLLRVKDPADNSDPAIRWTGALTGATASSLPVTINKATDLIAGLQDSQLMGYRLELAPAKMGQAAQSLNWQTLASHDYAAQTIDSNVTLANLDPRLYNNGVYQLRVTAWDLTGRTTTQVVTVLIDSTDKVARTVATDSVFSLGNHSLALTRQLLTGQTAVQQKDMGNWLLPLLDSQLTHDQPQTDSTGGAAPWREGAKVWLQLPNLSQNTSTGTGTDTGTATNDSTTANLSFTLGLQSLGNNLYRPVFTSSQGWQLTVGGLTSQPVQLTMQGSRLFDATTGLAWVPTSFVATDNAGTKYQLSGAGSIEQVVFSDNQSWLVSDNGVALVGDASQQTRVQFIRDDKGRIERIVGLASNGLLQSMVYRYDAQGQLVTARSLVGDSVNARYGYQADGSLLAADAKGYLGAAVQWADNSQNHWQGTLSNTPTHLTFGVRDSELQSTSKVAGATGSVIVAVRHTGNSQVNAEGQGTQVLGSYRNAKGVTTTLVRVTSAGFKALSLTGSGETAVDIVLAGDMNHDGNIDGLDSAALNKALTTQEMLADVNGDGVVDASDRQLLFSNYGFKANKAPVSIVVADKQAEFAKTHVDLAKQMSLAGVAQDLEGDQVFWKVVGSSHGVASLQADGKTLVFKPETGYTGKATITLQADDGFTSSQPIELGFTISDAKLLIVNIERIQGLALGSGDKLHLTGDFADEKGVELPADYVRFVSSNDKVVSVDALGNVRATGTGQAVVKVIARGIEAVNVFTVSVEQPSHYSGIEVDVYPLAVTLPLNGQRQLKVTEYDGTRIDAASKGSSYFISDSSIATISADGLIVAKQAGTAKVSVVNNGRQYDLTLHVQEPVVGTAVATAAEGAVVQDAKGNQLMVAAGSLKDGTKVSINEIDVKDVGMPPPGNGKLTGLGAFKIDIQGEKSNLPLQISLNTSNYTDPKTGEKLKAGTEIHFWRKGEIMDDQGVMHETWWLLDNGYVGEDGIARTASPPYSGITLGGNFYATVSAYDPNTGAARVKANSFPSALWAPSAFAAGAFIGLGGGFGALATISMLGAIASYDAIVYSMTYSIAGTYQKLVPNIADNLAKLTISFPEVPNVSITAPNINGLEYDPQTHKLTVKGTNFIPTGTKSNQFETKIWLVPKGDQMDKPNGATPERAMVYHGFTPTSVTENQLELTIDPRISLSLHDIYVERKAVITVNGEKQVSKKSVQSTHRALWDAGRYENTLVLSRDSIDIVKTGDKANQFAFVSSITKDENDNPVQFWGARTDSIAYSEDGLAYVTGNLRDGKIYVVDTNMRAIVHTIQLQNQSANISSLLMNDGWLYIAESDGAGSRLIRLLVDSSSPEYLKVQQTVDVGVQFASGISDMAISADRYLGLVVPKGQLSIGNFYGNFYESKKGDIVVLDLSKIDKKGKLQKGGYAKVQESALTSINRGGSPEFITQGAAAGEFVVSFAKDVNRGVVGVTALLQDGNLTNDFRLATTELKPDNDPKGYRSRAMLQNIQRASETVVAEFNGEEYAFVADYAFNFNDPTWNQWTETPIFAFPAIYWVPVQIPQPQIGGKIGIIKDPFGRKGKPEYVGATSAINGGAIKRLTLTDKGVLEAAVWMYDEPAPDGNGTTSKQTIFTWDAGALLTLAGAIENKSQPIDRVGIPTKYNPQAQFGEAIPKRFDSPDGVKEHEFGWIYGLESNNSELQSLGILKPTNIDVEKIVDNTILPNNNASVMYERFTSEAAYLVTALVAAQKSRLGYDTTQEMQEMKELNAYIDSLRYVNDGTTSDKIATGVIEFFDGLVMGLADIPLMLMDVDLRLALFIKTELLNAISKASGIKNDQTGQPITYYPPDAVNFSHVARKYAETGDEKQLYKDIGMIVAASNPVTGSAIAGWGLGSALYSGDAQEITKAALGLAALGMGARAAQAELNGLLNKRINSKSTPEQVAAQLKRIDEAKVKAQKINNQYAQAVKDFGSRLTQISKTNKMSVNARIILNRLGPVIHEGELFGTAFFSKWKSEFKASGKPVSLDTALSKAIEDGVVVGKNINNDGSLSYKLAEDVRPLTADEMSGFSEKLKLEYSTDLRVFKVEFKHPNGGEPVVKNIVIKMEDESFFSQDNKLPTEALAVYRMTTRLDKGASFIDSWVNNSDPIVIHMRKSLLETDLGFNNVLRQELSELSILQKELEKVGKIETSKDFDKTLRTIDQRSHEDADFMTAETMFNKGMLTKQDPYWKIFQGKMSKDHEAFVLDKLSAKQPGQVFENLVLYADIALNGTGLLKEFQINPDLLRLVQTKEGPKLRMVEAKSTATKEDFILDKTQNLKETLTSNEKESSNGGNQNVVYGELLNKERTMEFRLAKGTDPNIVRILKNNLKVLEERNGEYYLKIDRDAIDFHLRRYTDKDTAKIGNDGVGYDYDSPSSANPGDSSITYWDKLRTVTDYNELKYSGRRLNSDNQLISQNEKVIDLASSMNELDIQKIVSTAKLYWYKQGISMDKLQNINVIVADLPMNVLGNTNQNTVSISQNAGAYGWFIDNTPDDNEEFIMNAEQSVGYIKNTDNQHKVDLLSVLIHEIGHVIGYDDNDVKDNVMNGHLATGERRLPSTLFMNSTIILNSTKGSTGLIITNAPIPQGFTTWISNGIHSTLLDTEFKGDNWLTSGDIRFDNRTHSATLSEATNAQTSLRQAFALSADNRLLSFTIADKDIHSMANQAGDAFEVALLDAHTGQAISHIDGLSRTDSLLNIQANGTERLATGIKKVTNTDGTSTYYIDLANWYKAQTLAGKPTDVMLSFDLLGFGTADSHVSIKDITLSRDPVAVADSYRIDEDNVLQGNLLDNDITAGTTVTAINITTQPQHGKVTVTADGHFSYTPAQDYNGADSFSYQYTDAEGHSSNIANVSLTINPVNDAPVINVATLTGLINGQDIVAGKPVIIDLGTTGSDVDGDKLSVIITQQPKHGTLTQNANGTYTLVFDEKYEGTDSFSYTVSDGQTTAIPATATVNVLPSNKPPVATDSKLTLAEDGSIIIPMATLGSDENGDTLTVRITTQPQHGSLTQRKNEQGIIELVYTPVADYNGTDSFGYILNDGKADSNTATAVLTITPVNDAPIAKDDTVSTDEDTQVTIRVLDNDTDIDSAVLTPRIVTQAKNGTVTINADGTINYLPNKDFNGTDSFSYLINDGQADSNIATVSITIKPVNDAPELQGQIVSVTEDNTLIIKPLATASDVDGDKLSVVITSQPQHGKLVQQADGSYTYQGNQDYNGTDSISYYVTDGNLNSVVRTIDIMVTAVNDTPTVTDSLVIGMEDNSHTLRWTDFLMKDVENDTLTIKITQLAEAGVLLKLTANNTWDLVTINDSFTQADLDAGKLRFLPIANQSGGAGFTLAGFGDQRQHYARIGYQAFDGKLYSTTGYINVDIQAVADKPTLTITDKAVTNQLFNTDFEGISNADSNSTLLTNGMLGGWKLIRQSDQTAWEQWKRFFTQGSLPYGNDGFEIWHTGDSMADNWGIKRQVTASTSTANNTSWLELNDAAIGQSQTLGIEREVQTVKGANYHLSLDYAGRNGYSDCYTGISIYLGDTLLKHYQNTSPADRLNWQRISLDFVGTGQADKLRIVTDSAISGLFGRGAMLDNIQLTERTTSSQGREDQAITLASVKGVLTDTDGSEQLTMSISDIPVGTQLSDGKHSFVATQQQTSVNISTWQLDTLSLVPPSNFSGEMALTVTATSKELSNGSRMSQSQQMVIAVTAIADTPVISLTSQNNVARQVVLTDFNKVSNLDKGSDKLYWFDTGLTGGDTWQAVPAVLGKVNGFEFYSQGDVISIAGQSYNMNPVTNGQSWMMLHDGLGINNQSKAYQMLGITKNIATTAGLSYQVSFDYGVLRGLSSDELSRVQVYANDKLIGSYKGLSNPTQASDAITWQYINTSFVATGSNTTIKLMLDGVAIGDKSAKGRMVMLDNLSVIEYLPATLATTQGRVYAIAGAINPLPIIKLTSADTDGSERQMLTIKGIPSGVTISDGTRSFTNTCLETASLDMTGYDLTKLTMKTDACYTGDIKLILMASSVELSNNSQATTSYGLTVSVVSGTLAMPQGGNVTALSSGLATGSTTIVNTSSSLNTSVMSSPVLTVSELTVSGLTVAGLSTTSPVIADANTVGFSSVAPVRVDDELVIDKWLAMLEQRAKEKWLL